MSDHPQSPTAPDTGVALASRQALAWMAAANLVGLWMAVSLCWPRLGDALSPLGYGRWAPVHLNAQLYGWCALPLVALLLRAYFPSASHQAWPRSAVTAWSAALALGCVSWLSGHTSGKLFMDWQGASRVGIALALAWLALVLARGLRLHWAAWSRAARGWRCALLLALAPVPALMAWAANPRLYPTVNPDSGGATGSSLLGSTLVLIAIFLGTPFLLGLTRRAPASRHPAALPLLLALHFGLYAFVERGDSSHHSLLQVVGLFSLMIWPPLLVGHLRAFAWPPGARRWLFAFAAWGIFLTVSACLMFLPGWLDRGKFTHAFVGHTHAAMAGMLTSYLMLLLLGLNPGRIAEALAAPRPFVIWQLGCVAHVGLLMVAGLREARAPGILFTPDAGMDTLLLLRALAGLLMLEASARWWSRSRPTPIQDAPP